MTRPLAAAALLAALIAQPAAAQPAAQPAAAKPAAAKVALARIDCGKVLAKDFNAFFSDADQLPKGPREVASSCYLVRHMDHYLLWDTGLPKALVGTSADAGPMVLSLTTPIVDQLAKGGLKPADIDVVGISHSHSDHTGQAADFAGAKLVIGEKDFDQLKSAKDGDPVAAWRGANAKVQKMNGADVDIFGDGSVVALNLPGHTPGHMALRVRLASGTVLLSGDLYHSALAREVKSIPPFNTNRADTMASMDRFEKLAAANKARVIVQHEPGDIAKLAAYPGWTE